MASNPQQRCHRRAAFSLCFYADEFKVRKKHSTQCPNIWRSITNAEFYSFLKHGFKEQKPIAKSARAAISRISIFAVSTMQTSDANINAKSKYKYIKFVVKSFFSVEEKTHTRSWCTTPAEMLTSSASPTPPPAPDSFYSAVDLLPPNTSLLSELLLRRPALSCALIGTHIAEHNKRGALQIEFRVQRATGVFSNPFLALSWCGALAYH